MTSPCVLRCWFPVVCLFMGCTRVAPVNSDPAPVPLPAPIIVPDPAPETVPATVLIRNVTVIDATARAPQPGQDVFLNGGTIAAIAPTGSRTTPADATVIDGSGRFLVPGLWDMHVHLVDEGMMPQFLAAGVTGVRSMFSLHPLVSLANVRARIASGDLRGPHVIGTDSAVDGPGSRFSSVLLRGRLHTVKTPDDARVAVRRLKERGEPFVKVYDFVPANAYFALAEEARRQGLPLIGHVPFEVSAGAAAGAGQASIEHNSGLALACARNETELRAKLLKDPTNHSVTRRVELLAGDDFDEERAALLFEAFRCNGTYLVPTLVQPLGLARLDDRNRRKDPRRQTLTPFLRQLWAVEDVGAEVRLPMLNLRFSPEERSCLQQIHGNDLKMTEALHRAGVPLLAGTDRPNPDCLPGYGLHDELELLVKAGLSPLEALQTATLNPARFLGVAGRQGTVEVGKSADLVLLTADPLADINNIRSIHTVFLDGRPLRPEDLLKP